VDDITGFFFPGFFFEKKNWGKKQNASVATESEMSLKRCREEDVSNTPQNWNRACEPVSIPPYNESDLWRSLQPCYDGQDSSRKLDVQDLYKMYITEKRQTQEYDMQKFYKWMKDKPFSIPYCIFYNQFNTVWTLYRKRFLTDKCLNRVQMSSSHGYALDANHLTEEEKEYIVHVLSNVQIVLPDVAAQQEHQHFWNQVMKYTAPFHIDFWIAEKMKGMDHQEVLTKLRQKVTKEKYPRTWSHIQRCHSVCRERQLTQFANDEPKRQSSCKALEVFLVYNHGLLPMECKPYEDIYISEVRIMNMEQTVIRVKLTYNFPFFLEQYDFEWKQGNFHEKRRNEQNIHVETILSTILNELMKFCPWVLVLLILDFLPKMMRLEFSRYYILEDKHSGDTPLNAIEYRPYEFDLRGS